MRPLPPVGSYVQLVYPGRNVNNWPYPGTVRAVVEGECMLVARPRGGDHKGEMHWLAIPQDEWDAFDPSRSGGGGLLLLTLITPSEFY